MMEGCKCGSLFFFFYNPPRKTREHIFRAAVTHLAHIHLVSVFACSGAVCGEDGCAVAVGVIVDHADGIVQSLRLEDDQHRAEDLLGVALHLRLRTWIGTLSPTV